MIILVRVEYRGFNNSSKFFNAVVLSQGFCAWLLRQSTIDRVSSFVFITFRLFSLSWQFEYDLPKNVNDSLE